MAMTRDPARGSRRAPVLLAAARPAVRPASLALMTLVVAAFLMGGAGRGDVLSLIVLRPVAILLLGVGLATLRPEQVRSYRYLFVMAAALLALTIIQLVPLPPALWSRFPGREMIVEIDRLAGLGARWRPLSLAPAGTLNAALALFVPLAALVLGAQASESDRRRLLLILIAIGLASGLLALLQILGPRDSGLYFYRVTNAGSAVGLFSNRNHQAMFLATMFPMLAVFAALPLRGLKAVTRLTLAVGLGLCLIPLIFITGSRGGLMVAVVGLASTAWLYRPIAAPEGPGSVGRGRPAPEVRATGRYTGQLLTALGQVPRTFWIAAAGVAVIGISLLSVTMGRGEAFRRIFAGDDAGDFRFRAWTVVMQIIREYFPVGTGAGSFVEVYQAHEPRQLLDTTYFNHAHNDFLEAALTGGLPAILLLGGAGVLLIGRLTRVLRTPADTRSEQALFIRLGLVIVIQFAIASSGDYPLRTPALASFFALAALWSATSLGTRDVAHDRLAVDGAPSETRY